MKEGAPCLQTPRAVRALDIKLGRLDLALAIALEARSAKQARVARPRLVHPIASDVVGRVAELAHALPVDLTIYPRFPMSRLRSRSQRVRYY